MQTQRQFKLFIYFCLIYNKRVVHSKFKDKKMSCENCSQEVREMCCVAKGAKHNPAPIPQEGQ